MTISLDIELECRSRFSALRSGYVFADNAGGSQCLDDVVHRLSDYLLNTNVQLGADYSVSEASTKRVLEEGPAAATALFNAESPHEIAFGSSSTMLVRNLASAMEEDCQPGEEIIITGEHEANVGPWVRLAERRQLTVKIWQHRPTNPENPFSVSLHTDDLVDLISPKTRLVAFTACSNILGELVDVKKVAQIVRKQAAEKGTRKTEMCVDCVAYAPHRRVDVRDWDVEYAFFSYYKVYGPHTSVLYTRLAATSSLTSQMHYFFGPHLQGAAKLQPGGPGYELTYASTGVLPYFLALGTTTLTNGESDEAKLKRAFEGIAAQEEALMRPLIDFLVSKKDRGVRIVGLESADRTIRAPTISFVIVREGTVESKTTSKEVVARFDAVGKVGIRCGHFYAHRLITKLGINPKDGVVRISLVHYNTVEEVNRLIEILAGVVG